MWYVPTLIHGVAREATAHDVVDAAVVDPGYGEHGHVPRILRGLLLGRGRVGVAQVVRSVAGEEVQRPRWGRELRRGLEAAMLAVESRAQTLEYLGCKWLDGDILVRRGLYEWINQLHTSRDSCILMHTFDASRSMSMICFPDSMQRFGSPSHLE